MKWLSALILTGLLTMGCRSSQPATNPFLRTTVPPPGTGGAVVVQGEPYVPQGAPVAGAPMAAPQVIAPTVPAAPPYTPQPYTPAPMTPFTPAAPPPGAVSPPIVAPPPAMAPVPAGPPMVAPPKDKYSPPGGSFQYNQSSVQPVGPQGVVPAGYQQPGSPRLRAAIASWTAVQPAPAASEAKRDTPVETPPPASPPASSKNVSPATVAASSGTPGTAIRIGGSSKAPAATPAAKSVAAPVAPAAAATETPAIDPAAARVVDEVNRQQRQAAGNAAFKEVSRAVAPSGAPHLAIVTPDTVSDTTERFSQMAP